MKLKLIWICAVIAALLTACAPNIGGEQAQQPSPTAAVTPSEAPEPTATPEPVDTETDTKFTYWVEGVEMTVPAKEHHSLMGYSMVYDPELLTFEKHEGYDLYTDKAETNLPDVQIKISKESRTVSDIVSDLKKNGADDGGYLRLDGCEARVLHYIEGNSYDDVVKTYYVVQAGKQVLLIENSYFFEASEGSGMRMAQMVNTIKFADVPAAKELKILFRDKELKDFTSVIGDSTTLRVGTEAGAACRDVKWSSSDESVCTVTDNGGTCAVEITGQGVAEVTVTCGELSATTVVRGKKSW